MSTTQGSQSVRNRPQIDLEWLDGHFEALCLSDRQARWVARRRADEGPPPRFVFGRTRLGCLWRFGASESDEVVRTLARYAALEAPRAVSITAHPVQPERLEPMRRALEAVAPITRSWSGLAFRFELNAEDGDRSAAQAPDVIVAHQASDPRLDDWADALGEPVGDLRSALPVAVSFFDGRPVSVCRSTGGEAKGFVHARVETVVSARGHDHAPQVVAAWARAVAKAGGWPIYSTEWTNRSARKVAQKLALVAFACEWGFD